MGLDADDENAESAGNEDRMDLAPDWLAFALRVPMKDTPGRTYLYSSLNAFLAGAVVERATGGPLDVFATKHLFEPLGITKTEWRRGPNNRTAGQGNLRMRLRDMARIGEMVLHEGMSGGGKDSRRVVSSAWIKRSLTGIVPISASDPYADAYGYMWYLKKQMIGTRAVTVHFASGNGGNKIYVIPSHRMVVAITSSAYGRGYGQRRSRKSCSACWRLRRSVEPARHRATDPLWRTTPVRIRSPLTRWTNPGGSRGEHVSRRQLRLAVAVAVTIVVATVAGLIVRNQLKVPARP